MQPETIASGAPFEQSDSAYNNDAEAWALYDPNSNTFVIMGTYLAEGNGVAALTAEIQSAHPGYMQDWLSNDTSFIQFRISFYSRITPESGRSL